MVVVRNIWGTHTVAGAFALLQFALHVPVPLVDLALLKTEQLLQLNNLSLVPLSILLEFDQKNFILFVVLPQSLLCFLGSLDSVANNNARDNLLGS